MSPLREKFERELKIRGRSERTVHAYVASVYALTKYHRKSPDLISDEEIRNWLLHRLTVLKLSASSLNVAVNAIRSFHRYVLGRDPAAAVTGVPHCKRATKRAEVYALTEIAALLAAAPAVSIATPVLVRVYNVYVPVVPETVGLRMLPSTIACGSCVAPPPGRVRRTT
jgi:site-specific recombinase XerD